MTYKFEKGYRQWLFLSILLFGSGLAWGLTATTGTSGPLSGNVSALKKLSDFLSPLPPISVFAFIYLKNVVALLASFVLSPFFLLMPAAALILNGGILGLVAADVAHRKSVFYVLAGTLPHGIFELPAFFIGEAAAFSFGAAVLLALVRRDKRAQLLPNLKQNLKHLAVACILLLPAALIEAFVTPVLVR